MYGPLFRLKTGRQETAMATAGTPHSFYHNNIDSDAHVSLPQTMNELNREESAEEEAKNYNGGHAEVEDEVSYLSSGDEDFASETVSIENSFLIRANTKYGRAGRVNTRYIT